MLSLLLTFIIPMDLLRNRFGVLLSFILSSTEAQIKIRQELYWSILNIVAFALHEYNNPG